MRAGRADCHVPVLASVVRKPGTWLKAKVIWCLFLASV